MNKLNTIVCFFVFFLNFASGQNSDFPFIYAEHNNLFFNPAVSGCENNFSAGISCINQSVRMTGHPASAKIFFEMSLDSINSGISFTNNSLIVGPTNFFRNGLGYNYNYKINNENSIRTGISLFLNKEIIDESKIVVHDIVDDPSFGSKSTNSNMCCNFNFGLFYSYKKFNIGVAINNIFEPEVRFENNFFNHKVYRTSTLIFNYSFKINDNHKLYPSLFLLNYYNTYTYFYLFNLKYDYKEKIIFGLSFNKTNYVSGSIPVYCGLLLLNRLEIIFAIDLFNRGNLYISSDYFDRYGHSFGGSIRYKIKKNTHSNK